MRCEVARESLSARIDGERESVPAARVDEHLAQCPGCERWYASARGMNFAAADLAPDLSTTILEASRTSQHPHGGHRRYEVGVSRVATALRGGSVACAVAVVVLCFGYLTGSAPLWYPVVQGVLAVCAVGLAGAAALDSRRVRTAGPAVKPAAVESTTASSAGTVLDHDVAGADGRGVEDDSTSDVFDLTALRARRHQGPPTGDTRR
ncbi:zf-HC2 domain-containing protein [Gordonia otitidis]|uniref:zf-HC2 domain-containing protein n=1 Tax=Gordonia otitidis TaxID=249058 RepID=UPI001D1551B7|nr:zf-HC2 domain-containing protein [Gordonia otitidis]UEA58062.1 zf-HC2 domain-containing protein [Gordonia otitidis]